MLKNIKGKTCILIDSKQAPHTEIYCHQGSRIISIHATQKAHFKLARKKLFVTALFYKIKFDTILNFLKKKLEK